MENLKIPKNMDKVNLLETASLRMKASEKTIKLTIMDF